MSAYISENIRMLLGDMPEGTQLVAVSKFHPAGALREAYDAGQRVFGESRALELEAKAKELPSDIRWHFIGHLQTNKVRKVVAYADVIQSVDSSRLLETIDSEACKAERRIGVLLQVHVAREETKFGFSPDELSAYVTKDLIASLKSVDILGGMGMASNVDDEDRIRSDFRAIRHCFLNLKAEIFADDPKFSILSMGMSHDWHIAVSEGSNMIRVGTSIFGEREY